MPEVYEQTTGNIPASYGDDKIHLLVRDPHWLYAYWEVTQEKTECFIHEFGRQIWDKSVPYLKVTNLSIWESFYIRINDFSQDWYINVPSSNCLYMVEIGRKVSDRFFISLAVSNHVLTPGDNISSNTSSTFVDIHAVRKNQQIFPEMNVVNPPALKWENYLKTELKIQNIGLSSAQVYEEEIWEHLGISSGDIVR